VKNNHTDRDLPDWPGAAEAYSAAYKINIAIAKQEHAEWRRHNPGPNARGWTLPDGVIECIYALNKGDEKFIKDYIEMNEDYLDG